MTRHETGSYGEQIVKTLTAGGLGKIGRDSDIVLSDGTQIEVKTARKGKDGKYRARLYKPGSQDHRKSDYVVFVLLDDRVYFYVIPTDDIRDHVQLTITSHPNTYNGKYAQYKQESLACLLTL